MKKEILISVDGVETRVAVLEDGRLVEVSLEQPETERAAGNIYKAKVENVLPGMQAAFVDIGLEKNAFLYVADAAPVINADEVEGDEPPKIKKGLAINKLLRPGQKITVQVTKDPIGTKGARVSAYVTLPSHYVVLMPSVDYVGVSRRIADAKERQRLRTLAAKVKPRGMGVIVRTAAEGHADHEIQADIEYLAGLWRQVQQRAKGGTAPRVLHQDMGLVGRIVRDVLTESVSRVVVDSQEEFDRVRELLSATAPALRDRVERHDRSQGDLFAVFGVEAELDRALARRVWLKNGGYLIIDDTEAFTVFDVNTGRFVGSTSLAQTVLETNLEAAAEIARQLRLRDIGGIIIVDFIDMEVEDHRQQVLHRLEEHLRRDRTRSHVLGLTQLGLVEMTRKKVRQSLGDALTRPCPACEGRGRIMSEEAVAARVRREMRELLRGAEASQALLVEVHPAVASLLIGSTGLKLREIERELGKAVYIRGSEEMSREGSKFRLYGTKADIQAGAQPVQTGDVLELRIEEHHPSNRRDGIARLDGMVLDIEGGGDRVGERVKVEVTKVHRTSARARLLAPDRGAAPERPERKAPAGGTTEDPVSGRKQETRQARIEAGISAQAVSPAGVPAVAPPAAPSAGGGTTPAAATGAGAKAGAKVGARAGGKTGAKAGGRGGDKAAGRAGGRAAAAANAAANAAAPAVEPAGGPSAIAANAAAPAAAEDAPGPLPPIAASGAGVPTGGGPAASPAAANAEGKPSRRSRSRRRRGKGGAKSGPAAAAAAPGSAGATGAAAAPAEPPAPASDQPSRPAGPAGQAGPGEAAAGAKGAGAQGEEQPRKSRRRRGPRRKKAAGAAQTPAAESGGTPAVRDAGASPVAAGPSPAPATPAAAPAVAVVISTPPPALAPAPLAAGPYALSVPGAPLGPGRWPATVSRSGAAPPEVTPPPPAATTVAASTVAAAATTVAAATAPPQGSSEPPQSGEPPVQEAAKKQPRPRRRRQPKAATAAPAGEGEEAEGRGRGSTAGDDGATTSPQPSG